MISREDIQKLAALSRIKLKPGEEAKFAKEIDKIVGYVSEIKKAASGQPKQDNERVKNVWREDTKPHETGIYSKELLDEAPKRDGQYIKVKKILS